MLKEVKINRNSKISEWAHQLAIYAQQSILYEAVLFPKPGLVDPIDKGAHKDMDIYTFLDSAGSLYESFYQFALKGLLWDDSPGKLFQKIRPIGIEAEKRMLKETKNVNTHKGVIFSMGLFLAAAGLVLQKHLRDFCDFPIFQIVNTDEIFENISKMTKGLVLEDFRDIHKKEYLTHGEKLYLKYGFTGVRGLAEEGYSVIQNIIMPKMRSQNKEYSLQMRLLEICFILMSTVDDTNVVHRGGIEALDLVKKEAKRFIDKGGIAQKDALKRIEELNQLFIDRNISPGGSADLLSVAIFLAKLEDIL